MKTFTLCALLVISARVAIGLYHNGNMWKWIVTYWAILTIKNMLEVCAWTF